MPGYQSFPSPEEMEEDVLRKAAKIIEGLSFLIEDTDRRVYGLRHEKPIPNKLLVATRELMLLRKIVQDPLALSYIDAISEVADTIIDTHRKWPRMILGEGLIGSGVDNELTDREDVIYGGKGKNPLAFLADVFIKKRKELQEKEKETEETSPPPPGEAPTAEPEDEDENEYVEPFSGDE